MQSDVQEAAKLLAHATLMTAIADEQGRVVKPDQFSDRGYFYRSDQFSFAKIGVPAMYLDTGTDFIDRPPEYGREQQNHFTEVNYHQPSDEYDPKDYIRDYDEFLRERGE